MIKNGGETFSVNSFEKEVLPKRQDPETDKETWNKNLSPTNLVAIHITNTFPTDGVVRSHVGWTEHDGRRLKGVRDTIHFTLNHVVVEEHNGIDSKMRGSWHTRNFVVLAPFDKFKKEQIKNLIRQDTFTLGDFEIPQGSRVLIDWKELSLLRDSHVIDNDQMQSIIDQLGVSDNYISTETNPEKEIIVESNGIEYVIANVSDGEFRPYIEKQIKDMGYKFAYPNFNESFFEKYGFQPGRLHEGHPDGKPENLGVVMDNLVPLVFLDWFLLMGTTEYIDRFGNISEGYKYEDRFFTAKESLQEGLKKDYNFLQNISEDLRAKKYLKDRFFQYLFIIREITEVHLGKMGDGKFKDIFGEFKVWLEDFIKKNSIEIELDAEYCVDYLKSICNGYLKKIIEFEQPKSEDSIFHSPASVLLRYVQQFTKLLKSTHISESDRQVFYNFFVQLKDDLESNMQVGRIPDWHLSTIHKVMDTIDLVCE